MTTSLTEQAIQAFASGESVESITNSTETSDETFITEDSSVIDADVEPNQEEIEQPEEVLETEEPEIDYVTVTDDKGKRKVKIDYSDKDAIKRAHKMAAGMRKFQRERDSLNKELEPLRETQALWNDLESAYSSEGIDGLIKLLSGGQDSLDAYVSRELDRRQLKAEDPDAYNRLLEDEKAQAAVEAKDAERRKLEERLAALESDKESAELQATKAQVLPVFDKYRYAGKLGDEVAEHTFDEMLWNKALTKLEAYEEKGIEVTPGIINKEFKSASLVLSKYINKQATQKADKVVKQRKQAAKEAAQITAVSGDNKLRNDEKLMTQIKSGDLSGALSAFLSRK